MKRFTLVTTDSHGDIIETLHSDTLVDIAETVPEFVSQIENVAHGIKDPFDLYSVQILDHCYMSRQIMHYSVADALGL